MTKHIHPNHMVAHLWAHQSQESARTSNGTLSFNGTTIYSYSTPIANFIQDNDGERVALISSKYYSPTTGQHISNIHGAIGYGEDRTVPTYGVPYIGVTGGRSPRLPCNTELHAENVKYLLGKYATYLSCAKQRRSLWGEEERLQDAIATVREYAERFGISVELPNANDDWQSVLTHRAERETPEAIAKREKSKIARKEKARRDYREVRGIYGPTWQYRRLYSRQVAWPHSLHWIGRLPINTIFTEEDRTTRQANLAVINADCVSAWRNGSYGISLDWNDNILMRIRGDNIETSRGAIFPICHAKRAFSFIKQCRDNGKSYARNGHAIHLGHFTIDKIDEQGNVQAGCHNVQWDEIALIACQLGLV